MKYCSHCILPDTRPNIRINADGVCNACVNHARKDQIDWTARREAFAKVVANAKKRSRGYDCLIPVSGGKDSTWQVVTCLEQGMNPLAVTWKTPARTAIGARNLDNLINIGVDHIDYQINPEVERRFMYHALVEKGSTAIPMHMALFSIPLKIAVTFGIPLVVWGENSAFEYGSADEEHEGFRLDEAWLKTYGVTNGTTADDWVDHELSRKQLTPYFAPSESDLERVGVLAVFLGYYFQWSPQRSLEVATRHGFESDQDGPRTGLWNYADIDDDFISIHHYLKWYKFGITRLFDNLSIEIRNGRMTRDQAIDVVRDTGDQTPYADIRKFCEFANIAESHFFELIEKFRNSDIWTNDHGVWCINDFLINDWNWQ